MKRKIKAAAIVAIGVIGGFAILQIQLNQSADRVECVRNLKQLGLGLRNYVSKFDCLPIGSLRNAALPPEKRLSWLVEAWPYTGDGQRHFSIDRSGAWDSATNLHPTVRTIDPPDIDRPAVFRLYRCPLAAVRARDASGPGPTDYVGITGIGKDSATLPVNHPRAVVFGNDRLTTFADVKDGLSSTMALCETSVSHGPWTAAGKATLREVDPERQPYLGRGRPFGGLHSAGANVLFLDGSVRFVRNSVSPRVFEATATIAGGEPLELEHEEFALKPAVR